MIDSQQSICVLSKHEYLSTILSHCASTICGKLKNKKKPDKASKFLKLHNDWKHFSMIMPSAEHNTQLQSMEVIFFFWRFFSNSNSNSRCLWRENHQFLMVESNKSCIQFHGNLLASCSDISVWRLKPRQ